MTDTYHETQLRCPTHGRVDILVERNPSDKIYRLKCAVCDVEMKVEGANEGA